MNHKRLPNERCILVCMDKDCRDNGAKKVFKELEAAIEDRRLAGQVQAYKCECFGLCSKGPNVVAYPGGDWYTEAKPRDARLILEALNE